MEIFKLFGSIFIDNEEANKSIAKTEEKAGGLASKLGDGIKTAAKWGAGIAAGAVAAGAAVLGLASQASDTASRINDLSEKIGISKTAFQEWDYITSQVGANVEGFQMGVKTLSKAAYEAAQGTKTYAEAFDTLGVSVTNADGSLKDQETLLNEVMAALAGVEDKTARTALASQLLGRSATDLAPVLNMSAEEIENMRLKAHELGIVLSDEAIAAGDEFGDTMDTVKSTLGALFTTALAPLLPVINDLAQEFIKILPPLMSFIQPLIEMLIPVVQRLIEVLLPVFIKLLDAFMPVLNPLIELFLILLDNALMPLLVPLTELLVGILPPLIEVFNALMPAIQPLLVILGELLKNLLPPLINVLVFVSKIVAGVFSESFKSLTPVLENVMKAIGYLMDFWLNVFTGNWSKAWESLKNYFLSIWDAIVSYFKAAINQVISGVNVLIRGLNKIKFSIPDWVPGIGGKDFGIKISEVPKLAEGGEIISSGRVLVGEQGPEILELPQGAKVKPLGNTGPSTVIVEYDGRIIAQKTIEYMPKVLRIKGALS